MSGRRSPSQFDGLWGCRKCRVYKVSLAEASNGTTILGAVLPRGVSLARSFAFIRSCIVASLSNLCIHHLPLDSRVLLVHPFALLSVPVSLAPSLIYEQLRFSWYTRAFGSRAVSIETPRREKGGRSSFRGWKGEGLRSANRNMMEQDRDPLSSKRCAASLSLAKKGESFWFKFYCADNTVTVMFGFDSLPACGMRGEVKGTASEGRNSCGRRFVLSCMLQFAIWRHQLLFRLQYHYFLVIIK